MGSHRADIRRLGTLCHGVAGNRDFPQSPALALDLHIASRFRYARIEIENGDSPPLDVTDVTAYTTPAYLVFEPAGQPRFAVYAGNRDAPARRYESSRVLASMDTMVLAKCPTIVLNARAGSQPKAKHKGQALVWIVFGLVVLFTVWIFWNTARSVGKERAV
jgi:hypothetical protein